jgi:hypothetical protein
MSTAGKILTVLTMLTAVVWVLLTASVTQLNRNGAKAVKVYKEKIAVAEKQKTDTQIEIRTTVDETKLTGTRSQNDLTTRQAKLSEVEKIRSQMIESVTRVKLQLDGLNATVARGQADVKERVAERGTEKQGKAGSLALVEKLKGENGQLLAQLQSLRAKFRSTHESNKAMVQRRIQRQGNGVPTRPASIPGTP